MGQKHLRSFFASWYLPCHEGQTISWFKPNSESRRVSQQLCNNECYCNNRFLPATLLYTVETLIVLPWGCGLTVYITLLWYLFFFSPHPRICLLIWERERNREKHWCERETLIGCLLYTPFGVWEMLQPIEPPTRALVISLYFLSSLKNNKKNPVVSSKATFYFTDTSCPSHTPLPIPAGWTWAFFDSLSRILPMTGVAAQQSKVPEGTSFVLLLHWLLVGAWQCRWNWGPWIIHPFLLPPQMRASSQENSLPPRLLFDFWTTQTSPDGRRGLYEFRCCLLPNTRHCTFQYVACRHHASDLRWGYTCARGAMTWHYAKGLTIWESAASPSGEACHGGETCLRDSGRNGEGQEWPIGGQPDLCLKPPCSAQSAGLDAWPGCVPSVSLSAQAGLTTGSFNDESQARFH